MEGYSHADCVPISTDSKDLIVKWGEGRNLIHTTGAAANIETLATDEAIDYGSRAATIFKHRLRQPVKLRFILKGAKLYSFWVN